ncbi:hypothetical protein Tco_0914570, partial [Tanacetum coccineum]
PSSGLLPSVPSLDIQSIPHLDFRPRSKALLRIAIL